MFRLNLSSCYLFPFCLNSFLFSLSSFSFLFYLFFPLSILATPWDTEFPGQGSDLSHSGDLHRFLCTRVGTPSVIILEEGYCLFSFPTCQTLPMLFLYIIPSLWLFLQALLFTLSSPDIFILLASLSTFYVLPVVTSQIYLSSSVLRTLLQCCKNGSSITWTYFNYLKINILQKKCIFSTTQPPYSF